MTASRDEARTNFSEDAPAFRVDTPFHLYLDDTAFGQTSVAGDRDAYALRVDAGAIYTIRAPSNSNGFATVLDVYDGNGSVVASSSFSGGASTVRLTAVDAIYYVEARSAGPGVYSLSVVNTASSETVGIGEAITTGATVSAALGGASDSDHFTFNALVGHSYRVELTTSISDLNLLVSVRGTSSYAQLPTTVAGGTSSFTSTDNAALDFAVESSGFRGVGTYSFVVTDTTDFIFRGGTSASDNMSGGLANEQFALGTGDDTVSAGGGADTADGGSGLNYLRGDDGNDFLIGGANFDDINGNAGADTVSSGGGEDYCVGGKDNDLLSGGADYDLVYGNLGDDTCNGDDGNDVVRGGQGADVVGGGAGNDFVSGDKGDDTMSGGAGADVFHTFGDAGLDRVTDFSLAQGDRVQLDPGTVFAVSQSGADTVISMTGGGQMVLVGVSMSSLTPGWIFGA